MRSKFVIIVMALLLCLTSFPLMSDTASADTYGDYDYAIIDASSVQITGYHGTGGSVTIPSVIDTRNVTRINDNAFYENSNITSLTIPDTVTSIGAFAFYRCTALSTLVIGDNVTIIQEQAFFNCYSLTSLTFGKNVTEIQYYAFYNAAITSLTLPESLVTIGTYAFFYCDGLTSLTIPANVSSIGYGAFLQTSYLTSIFVDPDNPFFDSVDGILFNEAHTTIVQYPAGKAGSSYAIPDSVTIIGGAAFYYCLALTSVTIPSNVTTIGTRAFFNCDHLVSVTFPANVTSISSEVFYYCKALIYIGVEDGNLYYISIDGVLFDKPVSTLMYYPIGNTTSAYTVPESVTVIALEAFQWCEHIVSVSMGDNVTSIDNMAFWNCIALTNVTFGSDLTNIRYGAFAYCTVLASMTFKGDAPVLGDRWIEGSTGSLVIYFYEGAIGFTTPTWQGIPTVMFERPSAPQNLTATAGDDWARLAWDLPADNGGLSIDHFAVFQNGAEIGTTTDLNFTVNGLTTGQEYAFHVAAHNDVGNGDNSSIAYVIPLSVSITSPVGGSYTNDPTVEWTYYGNNTGKHVYVSVDGGGQVEIGSSATSYALSATSGAHTVNVTIVDNLGNSVSDEVTFSIDKTAPSLAITSPVSDSSTNSGAVTVNWTASDGASGIASIMFGIFDGESWSNTTLGSSVRSRALTLEDGEYTVAVRVTDNAGNYLGSSVSFTVDTAGPSIEIISPATGSITNNGTVTVNWTAEDDLSGIDSYLFCCYDGEGWTNVSLASSITSRQLTLGDGVYTAVVRAYDALGNFAEASITLTVDTVDPTLNITSPSEGALLSSTSVNVTWMTEDVLSGIAYINVSIFNGTGWDNATLGASARNILFDLEDGAFTIYIKVVDNAGNERALNVTFAIDVTAPMAEVSPTGNWVPIYTNIVVEFSEAMNATSVSIVIDGVPGHVSWSGNTATFDPDQTLNWNIEYQVTISGKDLAGNGLEMSWTFNTSQLTLFVGVIVDENGDPLTGVTVMISNSTSSETQVTGADGSFSFGYGFEIFGPFNITASKDGYQTLTVENVTVELGGTNDLGDLEMLAEDVDDGSSGSDGMLLIAGAVVIIAIVGGAGYLIFQRKKK